MNDITAVLRLPLRYPKRLRTTNGIERLNRQEKGKSYSHLPNEALAVRFIGALPIEQDEKWLTGWKYFEMDAYYHSISAQEESDEQFA